jgi:hypothetical protein
LRALGERAVAEIIRNWRDSLTSSMTPAQIVKGLLRSAVEFWRKQLKRARLLLEGVHRSRPKPASSWPRISLLNCPMR